MSPEPNWQAMVEAARALHGPSLSIAAECEDGTCYFCGPDYSDNPTRLIERRCDYLGDGRTKVWTHFHEDRDPYCVRCASGYTGRADWPCETAIALGMTT